MFLTNHVLVSQNKLTQHCPVKVCTSLLHSGVMVNKTNYVLFESILTIGMLDMLSTPLHRRNCFLFSVIIAVFTSNRLREAFRYIPKVYLLDWFDFITSVHNLMHNFGMELPIYGIEINTITLLTQNYL